jgi:dienelactone hydrolase
VRAPKREIEGAGGTVMAHEYAGARHAFCTDDQPEVYHRPPAATAWVRRIELFRHTLTR